MRNKEDKIREQRTIEATKKGFMNSNGKIATIAKMMGDKVVAKHGHNYGSGNASSMFDVFSFDQSFIDETYEEDLLEIPMAQEDGHRYTASLFNGYSRGLHLEIKYDGPEIYVLWEGYLVYSEMAGELTTYCPGEWEQPVEKLSIEARRRETNTIVTIEERNEKVGQRNKANFIEEMRKKWGL